MSHDQDFARSEHDFLAFCAKLEAEPKGWETLKVNFAQTINQREILRDRTAAPDRLKTARQVALDTFHKINEAAKAPKTEAVSYIFTDNDIMLFADIDSPDIRGRFMTFEDETRKTLPPGVALEHWVAAGEIGEIKQIADDKMRTARVVRALSALAVENPRQDTLAIKRKNRTLPLVMLVEDDRFTAAYTVQLLSKDYEVFHVRSGEEAIDYYLDYAPDAVFIDMHLPGMSGADTLHMIKTMDPDAYCVILSVDTARSTVLLASGDGANSYLRKPYNKDRLLWTVRQSPHIAALPPRLSEVVHT